MARVVLQKPEGHLAAGPSGVDRRAGGGEEGRVAVAADAVQDVRDWKAVFGRATVRRSRPGRSNGRSDGKYVEVREGLRAGDRYAQTNSYLVKAELGKAGASHDH